MVPHLDTGSLFGERDNHFTVIPDGALVGITHGSPVAIEDEIGEGIFTELPIEDVAGLGDQSILIPRFDGSHKVGIDILHESTVDEFGIHPLERLQSIESRRKVALLCVSLGEIFDKGDELVVECRQCRHDLIDDGEYFFKRCHHKK